MKRIRSTMRMNANVNKTIITIFIIVLLFLLYSQWWWWCCWFFLLSEKWNSSNERMKERKKKLQQQNHRCAIWKIGKKPKKSKKKKYNAVVMHSVMCWGSIIIIINSSGSSTTIDCEKCWKAINVSHGPLWRLSMAIESWNETTNAQHMSFRIENDVQKNKNAWNLYIAKFTAASAKLLEENLRVNTNDCHFFLSLSVCWCVFDIDDVGLGLETKAPNNGSIELKLMTVNRFRFIRRSKHTI